MCCVKNMQLMESAASFRATPAAAAAEQQSPTKRCEAMRQSARRAVECGEESRSAGEAVGSCVPDVRVRCMRGYDDFERVWQA